MTKTYKIPPMRGLCHHCFASNIELTLQQGIPLCGDCKK